MTERNSYPLSGQARNRGAISLFEVAAFLICAAIVLSLSLWLLHAGRKSAYDITVRHDLRKFVEAELAYRVENNTYKGEEGDFVTNIPQQTSTFTLDGFQPSEGVCITIISIEPFCALAQHWKTTVGWEHNFSTGTTSKRRK